MVVVVVVWNETFDYRLVLFYSIIYQSFFCCWCKMKYKKTFFRFIEFDCWNDKERSDFLCRFCYQFVILFCEFPFFFCVCIGWKSFFLLFSLPSFCWFFSLVWGLNFLWIVKLSVTIFRSFFLLLFLYKTDKNLLLFVIISTMGNEL